MAQATVYLLDDDERVLKSLNRLLSAEGLLVQPFSSATTFLEAHDADLPGCLVMDLLLPGMNGIAVQRELKQRRCIRPIIFVSGTSGIPDCATVMKAGALDFLPKPVERDQLLDAIGRAMARDSQLRERAVVASRLASLTPRQRQVIDGVVEGLLNKQIANRLSIVEKTVKVHRASAMAKMGARSTAELVRMMISISTSGAESWRDDRGDETSD